MAKHPLPRPINTPTQLVHVSTKKPGVPIVRVDRIRFLRSSTSDYESSDSDGSSSCSTTTRGRRRFRRQRPTRVASPKKDRRYIKSGVMEITIGRRARAALLTNAATAAQEDDCDSSFSSLSSYETGLESDSEDEKVPSLENALRVAG
jgi:hypothetical protein